MNANDLLIPYPVGPSMLDRARAFENLVGSEAFEVFSRIPQVQNRYDYTYYLHHYALLLPDPCRILEVGTSHGGSALVMANALRGRHALIVTIDPRFLTPEEQKDRGAELVDHEVQDMTDPWALNRIANLAKELQLDGYVSIIPDTSQSVLERWDGRPINMLYVDGEHSYDAVSIDTQWMNWVVPGGVAVFDDWVPPVEKAVFEFVGGHPEWQVVTRANDQPPGFSWLTALYKNPQP